MRHYEGKVFVKCAEPEKLDVFSYYDCILWQVSFYKICTFFSKKEEKEEKESRFRVWFVAISGQFQCNNEAKPPFCCYCRYYS